MKLQPLLLGLLLGALLVTGAVSASEPNTAPEQSQTAEPNRISEQHKLTQQLAAAEAIRSSQPVRFSELLSELEAERSSLSNEQKHYLDYLQGYQLSFTGKLELGLEKYKQLIGSDASPLLQYRANLAIVNNLAVTRDWPQGLTHLALALEALPNISDEAMRQNGLVVAAIFYNQLGQYELGLKYASRLENTATAGRTLCFAKQLKLEARFNLHSLETDSPEIQDGIKVCEQQGEAVLSNFIRIHLANVYLKSADSQSALILLTPHLAEVEATHYPRLIAEFYSVMARAHWALQQPELAEHYALKALELGKSLDATQPIVQVYETLYQIALQRNDYQTALDYHIKFAEADKAYLDETKTKFLAYQLAQHQSIEQQSKISLLDKQNNLLRLEQQLASAEAENNRLFIALLILCVTALLVLIYRAGRTHKRLRTLAEYDALTGVYNRGHCTQLATASLDYCRNSSQEISCILLDLDNFKAINDNYGHACGDWVLKKVASVCMASTRKNDIFARLGGEEFFLLLPGCDLDRAMALAERLRAGLAAIDTADSGFSFAISASLGVTGSALSGFELEQLIADADTGMYHAKKSGRDRVSLYSSELREQEQRQHQAAMASQDEFSAA
ncbi:GGDEF domain-containing protein [Shewanella salipaludis]|uniref:diguanylate cyclase n=1 Tax=Shewanella salipaludis TaxID=2723052 RepID=A0A972FRP9_9GAMM|nr:GGDEF domain-containing protein [Shewanella salipaludis]NMH64953.1 GGDEF domain-containing protein [Shewanella salipaludis]